MSFVSRVPGRLRPLWIVALGALVVSVVVVAWPRTGVREMVAGETDPELRAVALQMRALQQSLEQQAESIAQLREENEQLRAAQEELEASAQAKPATADGSVALRLYPIPSHVEFLGEVLPLERADVRQRFEEEWLRYLVNRHWLVKWHRRTAEVFPAIERKLEAAGMPEDLKYVMVIESGVDARAVSSAGAEGWWQFMVGTAKEYGLDRSSHLDDRRDLDRSTDAAIRHFRDLYEEFGSWPLVLSAYNAGARRVKDSMQEQGEESFYDMVLPTETEAYWFKAAAAKILLENPERYRIQLGEVAVAPVVCDTLDIRVLGSRLDLRTLTAGSDLSYRELKELNPSFRRSYLPQGTYRVVVPARATEPVVAALDGAKLLRRSAAQAPVVADAEAVKTDAVADTPPVSSQQP